MRFMSLSILTKMFQARLGTLGTAREDGRYCFFSGWLIITNNCSTGDITGITADLCDTNWNTIDRRRSQRNMGIGGTTLTTVYH